MRGKEVEITSIKIRNQLDRRRETAIDRKNWTFFYAREHIGVRRLGQLQHAALDLRTIRKLERQIAAILADQTKCQRGHHWLLGRLFRGGREALLAFERVGLAGGIE